LVDALSDDDEAAGADFIVGFIFGDDVFGVDFGVEVEVIDDLDGVVGI
jgi:hypothetical protein